MKRSKIILAVLILSTIALIFSGCGGGGTTPPINHSPTITSLTANPQSPIEINQSTVITCSASDPDGDPLAYTWTKTGGTITGIGYAITWIAPSTTGTYTITCIVSDGELTDEQSISIDVEQELPPDTTEPELIEIASGEIDLNEGGVVEVTDPNSELYGLKLTIEPQKNIRENKGTPVINIAIYCALLDICKLPDYQGFLITPFIIKSDFTDALFGKLEIPYYMEQLINSGVAINAPVKVCRVFSPPLPWVELSSDKYTVSNNIANIPIGIGDFMYYYTLTVNNAVPPNSNGFKSPQPGDLLYKFSKLPPANINEGWCSGHVGIYVGERYDEGEEKPYNVIEALLGGVTRSNHSPISKFGGNSIYLGAREPEGGLSHQQRNKIIEFVEAAATAHIPYAWFETFTSVIYSGLGYGNAVKGPDKFNCVGLTEAAYEYAGVDLVSNYDEGNVIYGPYHILTPAEQWYKTVPTSGVLVQNNPPNITSTPVTSATKEQPYSYDVNATDSDGDTLVYSLTTKPTGMTINSSTGLIAWTPTTSGDYDVIVKVSDGELFDTQSFTVTSEQKILTSEEIELIRKWGYGGDYVVRWPNGYVDVYDATNYNQMQKVLNQWNTVIGGPVILRLSSNPNSPVKVIFDSNIGQEGYCWTVNNQEGGDYTFSEVMIKINYDESFCGYPNTTYTAYLCAFNAVAGFDYWAEVSPTPFVEWTNFSTIPDTIKTMLNALYRVPPGYYLGKSKQMKNHYNIIIKNVFTSGGGNCLNAQKK